MTPRIAPRSAPKRPANATDELALELKLQKARNLKQRISALIDRDEAFYQRFESLCEEIEHAEKAKQLAEKTKQLAKQEAATIVQVAPFSSSDPAFTPTVPEGAVEAEPKPSMPSAVKMEASVVVDDPYGAARIVALLDDSVGGASTAYRTVL